MITWSVEIDGKKYTMCPGGECRRAVVYYGLSTDVKPVEGVKNSSVFYEMDKTVGSDGIKRNRIFMFDEENHAWLEQ